MTNQSQEAMGRTVEQAKDKLSPFALHLLEGEKRFRLHQFFGEGGGAGFFWTPTSIHIPYGLPAIEHEIAHMVELENEQRCLLPDWGLSNFAPKIGQEIQPKLLIAALSREDRVRAIQSLMCDKGYPSILDNSIWAEWAQMMIPFGRFKSMQDAREWSAHVRASTIQRWSLDRIEHEWKRRLALIQDRMETA